MLNQGSSEIAHGLSTIEKAVYRDAMARMGAAVNIVTSDGPAGQAGFTASAVCSVTDAPPTLLVCLNRSASAYESVIANKVLCVNTLGSKHENLSRLFGGQTPMAERFRAADWSTLETGAPVLDGALVAFDCCIKSVVNQGTHDVMFCEVVAIQEGDLEHHGLFYFGRKYHNLGSVAQPPR